MRSLWKQKWLVVVGALTIFLSIGAAAWAAADDQPASGRGTQAEAAIGATGSDDGSQGLGEKPGAALRKAMKERRDQWLERQEALMEALRDDMTLEDQATYDELVATAKEKREALQAARQDLAATLKELRALTDKYLDVDGGDSGG